MNKIIILLIVMIILSLFSGISINHNWFFIYQFECIDYPKIISAGHANVKKTLLWGIIVLTHFGIVSLLFTIRTTYFNKILLWVPLIYLLGYVFLRGEFIILLIPFIIIWIVTIRLAKRLEISHKHSI